MICLFLETIRIVKINVGEAIAVGDFARRGAKSSRRATYSSICSFPVHGG